MRYVFCVLGFNAHNLKLIMHYLYKFAQMCIILCNKFIKAELVRKNVAFSTTLYNQAEKIAKKQGILTAELIRSVVVDNLDEEVEYLDEKTERKIARAVSNFKKGNFFFIKGNESVSEMLNAMRKT